MKKFFKNIRKKSPARSGPPAEGSPKLDNRSTASLVIGYDVREKELGKLHKAAWLGDVGKVQQLAKKDPSPLDKEKRYVLLINFSNLYMLHLLYFCDIWLMNSLLNHVYRLTLCDNNTANI